MSWPDREERMEDALHHLVDLVERLTVAVEIAVQQRQRTRRKAADATEPCPKCGGYFTPQGIRLHVAKCVPRQGADWRKERESGPLPPTPGEEQIQRIEEFKRDGQGPSDPTL